MNFIYVYLLLFSVSSAFGQKSCNWREQSTFSDIFTPENQNMRLECVSVGEWPSHSRAPCDIDDKGFGGMIHALIHNCQYSMDGNNMVCQSKITWDPIYINKFVIHNETLICNCEDHKSPTDCKWIVRIEFKLMQRDLTMLEKIFLITIIVIIIGLLAEFNMLGIVCALVLIGGDSLNTKTDNYGRAQ